MDIPPPPSSKPPPAPPPGIPTFPTPPHVTDAPPPPYGFGPGAPPPPPYYPGGPTQPQPVKRSGLAIAAMVLGIVGIVTCFIAVPSLLALIFGLVAARSIKRAAVAGTPVSGLGMARAGWILGLVGVALFGLFVTLAATGALDDEDTDIRSLDVGDCVELEDLEPDAIVAELPRVDCEDPHDGEVFVVDDLPAGPYPGLNAVTNQVNDRCTEEFEPYVGTAYEESELDFQLFYPLERNWRIDRGFLCVIIPLDGNSLVGSVEGSGR